MKIRAILLDFDGTSLQKDQVYITMRNMHAIRRALDQGVFVIPCTGRSEDMHPPQIEAEKRIRYWVTSGGARVVDREKGEVLYTSLWTPEESALLCRIFEDRAIYGELAANGKIFMEKDVAEHLERYRVPPHHIWFVESGRQIAIEHPSVYFKAHGIGMEKVNLYDVPEAYQQEIYDALEQTGLVGMTDPVGALIQFFPKHQDRAEAIRVLLGHIGVKPEEVLSLGDNYMDLPAIELAGVGVAMGNAPEQVRAKADDVAPPYDEDGVAFAIEKYVLNER